MAKKFSKFEFNLTVYSGGGMRNMARVFTQDEIAHITEAEFLNLLRVSAVSYLREAGITFGSELGS